MKYKILSSPLIGHCDPVYSLAFSPNGRLLVGSSAGFDEEDVKNGKVTRKVAGINVWDAHTFEELPSRFEVFQTVRAVAFSPDGSLLAGGCERGGSIDRITGWENGVVKLWYVVDGYEVATFAGPEATPRTVAFHPSGLSLVSGNGFRYPNGLVEWSLETRKAMKTLRSSTKGISSVTFSPNGKILITGSEDNVVRVIDTTTGQLTRKLKGHIWSVNSVAFSPNGKFFASGGGITFIKIWDAATNQEIVTIDNHLSFVNKVIFSPDSSLLASCSDDTSVRVWEVPSGRELLVIKGHYVPVKSLAFSPDGKLLVSGDTNGTIKVWEIER